MINLKKRFMNFTIDMWEAIRNGSKFGVAIVRREQSENLTPHDPFRPLVISG